MKTLYAWTVLASLVWAGSGLAQDTTTREQATSFVQQAARANAVEIDLAQLAQSRAARADVKQFAQALFADHTDAKQQIEELARVKRVALTTDIAAEDARAKTDLSKLTGAAFDAAYVTRQIDAHASALDLYERESKAGADAEIRAWAERALPTIRRHLERARELQKPRY